MRLDRATTVRIILTCIILVGRVLYARKLVITGGFLQVQSQSRETTSLLYNAFAFEFTVVRCIRPQYRSA